MYEIRLQVHCCILVKVRYNNFLLELRFKNCQKVLTQQKLRIFQIQTGYKAIVRQKIRHL